MTIRSRIILITMVAVLSACQQKTTSRSRAGFVGSSSASLQIELQGEFKPETVRGYLLNHHATLQVKPDTAPLFSIDAVPTGSYELWVFADSTTGAPLAAALPIPDYKPGQPAVTVALVNSATITGSFIGDSGKIKGLTVSISGSDFKATPDDKFSFTITGLPAATMNLSVTDSTTEISKAEGLVTEAGAILSLNPIDLSGTVTGPVVTTPSTSTPKLAGGAVILNNGNAKSGSLTVPVTFVPPTGATEVVFSQDIALTGAWGPIPQAYSHTFSGTGQQTLYAKFRSASGVESDQLYASVDINTSAPAAGSITLASGIMFTKTRVNNLAVTATGVGDMRFALTQAGLDTTAWVPFAATFNGFNLGDDLEGIHPVWFQFRSLHGVAGNAQSTNVTVVKTGPAISALVTKTGKSSFSDKDVVLTVTPGTTPYDIKNYKVSCDGVKFVTGSFIPATPDITVDITTILTGCTSAEGSRTISIYLEDSLGNVGTPANIIIDYDITAPAAPIVAQASGTYTPLATVTVSGTAEALSSILVTGGAADATTATDGAGNYTVNVNLNPNVLNTLIVSATDAADNTSSPTVFTITNDMIAPTVTSGPFVKLTAETMEISWTSSESATDVVDYGINVSYGSQATDSSPALSHTVFIDNLGQNTQYHYQITLTDLAGNTSSTTDAFVRTYIDKSSILLDNEVWDQTSTPYFVSGNFRIDPSYTIRIKKGVTVALDTGTQIWVRGTLIAEGTSSEPVTFTTNNPTPAPGDWDRIEFNNVSAGAYAEPYIYGSGSRLDHVVVEYGGSNGPSVMINQQSASITNSTIRNSAGVGIFISDKFGAGTVSIRGNRFESNSGGVRTSLYDPLLFGQKVYIADNTFINNTGKALDIKTYDTADIHRNLILGNQAGLYFASTNATVRHNIFNKTPGAFVLEPESGTPLILTANKNAILGSTAASSTVIEDGSALSGTDATYTLTFSENTIHNNKVTNSGDALIHLDHPDSFDITYAAYVTANFLNNNFINNNPGSTDTFVMLTKSFRDYNDITAQNNYWDSSNPLTVQQQYIWDFTDNSAYRSVAYAPILSKHYAVAPMSQPRNLTVTSPAPGSAELTWTINGEADTGGYFIYYSLSANTPLTGTGATEGPSKIDTEAGGVTCSLTGSTKKCTLTGLTPATPYYFSVTAYDGGDKAEKSFTEPGPANTGSDEITITAHGFRDGQRVRMSTVVGGTLPGGISAGTNYWVTYIDANTIKLRTTEAPGSDIDISAPGVNTCKVVPNLPFKTLDYIEQAIAAPNVNLATNRLTQVAHGYQNGVRGKISATGTYLGIDSSTEYFVSVLDANTFLLSRQGTGISVLDIGLDNGHQIFNADIDFTGDTFSVQNHNFVNDTEIQFTTTGTLPSPLATLTNYYIVNATQHTFQVSTIVSGAAVDMTEPAPNSDKHTMMPTTPGTGGLTFTPNYPDITRQDFQVLGNESWYTNEVSITIN